MKGVGAGELLILPVLDMPERQAMTVKVVQFGEGEAYIPRKA